MAQRGSLLIPTRDVYSPPHIDVAWSRSGMVENALMRQYNSFLESRSAARRSALRAKVSNQGYLWAAPAGSTDKAAGAAQKPAATASTKSEAAAKNATKPATQQPKTENQSKKTAQATAPAKQAKDGQVTAQATPKPAASGAPQVPLDISKEFPQLDIFANDPNAPLDISLLPPDLRYPLQTLPPLTKCPVPTRIRVRQEAFNAKLQVDRKVLQALIGEARDFAQRETTVEGQSFACVDSRKQGAILGTPGGDFGEFLVALSVMEELNKRNFTDSEVQDLLRKWVVWDRKGNFPIFHNTDEAAIRHLAKGLHVNGKAGVLTDIDIKNPPVELRAEILRALDQVENQGSPVIKAFLNFADKFLIRRELTASLLRAYYTLLWDRDTPMPPPEDDLANPTAALKRVYGVKDTTRPQFIYQRLNLEIYSGEPNPRAWISVRSSRGCEIAGAAHKFSPKNPVPLRVFPSNAPEVKQAEAAKKAAATAPAKEAQEKAKQAAAAQAKAKALIEATPAAQVLGGLSPEDLHALGVDGVDFEALFGQSPIMLETDVDISNPEEPIVVTEVFVHHPHAVNVQRKWLSRFFALQFPLAGKQDKVYKQILRRQLAVTELVAEMLGRSTPFYTITVE